MSTSDPSRQHRDYVGTMEAKIARCHQALGDGRIDDARRERPELGGSGDLYEGVASPAEFGEAFVAASDSGTLEGALEELSEVDWDRAFVRECQLALLSAHLALEDRNFDELADSIRHLAKLSAHLNNVALPKMDRFSNTVLALADQDFSKWEIVVRTATAYLEAGDLASANVWLRRAPDSDPGVFGALFEHLQQAVASPCTPVDDVSDG